MSKQFITIYSIISLLFFVGNLAAKTNYTPLAESEEYPFLIVTKDTVQALPAISDERFYEISTSVLFKVGKSDISPDDPFFDLYRNEVLPRINSGHLQLRKVIIRGAASPEGPYSLNQRLGRQRSQALLDELQRGLGHQYVESKLEISSITEDYAYLCILMEKAGDPDYAMVQGIYDSCGGNELAIKQRLMAARGGRLWKRMLKQYFPQLRTARMVLWFSEPDEAHAPLGTFGPSESASAFVLFPAPDLADPCRWPDFENQPESNPRRHLIAVRTNLVHDFFYMPKVGWSPSPNIQFEYYPRDGHWTANIGFTWGNYRHWDAHTFFQVRDLQIEARRYFKGHGEFTGFYLGAALQGDIYGIGISTTQGWQGEGGAASITAGYVLPLTRKGDLRLEFMVGLGAFISVFDPYVYGNPVTGDIDGYYYYNYLGSATDFKRRNHLLTWYGPTNLGIQLTYDIIYRKKQSDKR